MKSISNNMLLWLLLPITFIDWVTIGIVYPIFSTMIFEGDTPYFPIGNSETVQGLWFGILLAASTFAQFFSSPIIGTYSDQKGRKPCLILSVGIIFLGYVMSVWAMLIKNIYLLLISRLVEGTGAANATVVNAMIADISKPDEKVRNFGLVSMAKGLGFAVGPSLGGILSEWGGYDKPFIFAGSFVLLNFISLLLFLPETHTQGIKKAFHWNLGIKHLKQAFYHKNLRFIFLSCFVFFIGFALYWEFISVTWIERYKQTTAQVGHLYAYGAAVYAISAGILIRPIVNRYNNLPILFTSQLLLPLAILPLLLPVSISWYWGFITVQEFLIALIFTTTIAFISNSVPEDSQGEILGTYQSLESCAITLTPLVSGLIVGSHYNLPILGGGLLALVAALIILFSYGKKIWTIKN